MNNPGSNNFGNPQGGGPQPTQMFCPSCGNANVAYAAFCTWCGNRLSPPAQTQPGQALAAQPQQPYPTYAAPQQPPQYPPGQSTVVYPPAGQQSYPYQQPPPSYPTGASSNMTVVMQGPPPQQAYPRQYTAPQKSVGLAVLLAFLFGPLGMFYSTIGGAITMLLASCALTSGVFIFGIGGTRDYYGYSNSGPWLVLFIGAYIFFQIICMVWAGVAASSHNRRAMYG